MKIEIDFDSRTFKEIYSLNFDMLWKARTNFSIGVIVWSLISILLGSFVLLDDNQIGYVIILTSLLCIIAATLFLLKQIRLRKRYNTGIEKEIEEYNKRSQAPILFEFLDDYFHYQDRKMDLKYTYDGMQGYRLARDIIFIDISKERYITFAIGTSQLGNDKAQQLLELLKQQFPNAIKVKNDEES